MNLTESAAIKFNSLFTNIPLGGLFTGFTAPIWEASMNPHLGRAFHLNEVPYYYASSFPLQFANVGTDGVPVIPTSQHAVICDIISAYFNPTWEKLWENYNSTTNLFNNYNYTETRSLTGTSEESGTTRDTFTGTDSSTHTGGYTDTETPTGTETDTISRSGSERNVRTPNTTTISTVTPHGQDIDVQAGSVTVSESGTLTTATENKATAFNADTASPTTSSTVTETPSNRQTTTTYNPSSGDNTHQGLTTYHMYSSDRNTATNTTTSGTDTSTRSFENREDTRTRTYSNRQTINTRLYNNDVSATEHDTVNTVHHGKVVDTTNGGTITITGNRGLSPVDILVQERSLYLTPFFERVFNDLKSFLTIPYYGGLNQLPY